MKKLQILLLLVLAISACTTEKENVKITGTVTNKENTALLYSAIFNDTFNGWFKDSIIPDANGHFNLSLKISQPCFIALSSNSGYKQIIIEPGQAYEIEEEQGHIKLINKSDAQFFYENLPDRHPLACRFFQGDVSEYENIYDSVNNELDNELEELSKINCSEEVRDLIRKDRQVYHNLVISSLASRNNFTAIQNNETTPKVVMKMWGKAVSDTFLTNVTTKKATYYYDLLELAFWYNVYTKLDYDSLKIIRKEKREQGLIHTHNVELAKEILPDEILEYYNATYIQDKAKQDRFEKELISLFEQFKKDYSNSQYIKYISSSINEIVDFHEKAAINFNENIEFIGNDKTINSLNDCLRPFKGQKVYVDIWSTSCGWCKEEFAYNEKLKQTLNNKGVEILYLSLDRDHTQKRWEDMIKYYNLTGKHVRANVKLKADLRNKFGRFGVPRYLIVDKQGNVINDDAPRPSNISALEKQL